MFSKYLLRASPRGGVGVGSTVGQVIKLIKNWSQNGDKLSLVPQRKPWSTNFFIMLVPPKAARPVFGTLTPEGCC